MLYIILFRESPTMNWRAVAGARIYTDKAQAESDFDFYNAAAKFYEYRLFEVKE